MASIRTELEQLPDDASRARVVRWAADLANIAVRPAVQTPELPISQATRGGESLGAILDRASPQTRPDLILAVAHWLELTTLTTQARCLKRGLFAWVLHKVART
jgi:hypothetical protein